LGKETSPLKMLCYVAFALLGHLAVVTAQTPAPTPSAITLTANITSLQTNVAYVSVAFRGASVTPGDAIAFVQNASTTNFAASPPQKFQWVVTSNDSAALTTGFGNVTFRTLNTRQPFRFIYVTDIGSWSTGNFTVLATTPAIPVANPDSPFQVRMSLTNVTGQMVISWTTASRTANPIVQYGTTSGAYSSNATAVFDNYTRSDMCGAIANASGWSDPGIFNNALLKNLTANTRYYSVVGDPAIGVSQEFSFKTPPLPGSDDPVSFFAIADLGFCESDNSLLWEASYPNDITHTAPTSLAALKTQFNNILNGNWLSFCAGKMVVKAMLADSFPASLLIHNGDLSYAQGFEYGWEVYQDMMAPLIANMPYMVVEGNHERDFPGTGDRYGSAKDSGGECGVVAAKRFPMPYQGSQKHWYAFGYGPIYFIQFSTEVDFATGSDQFNFIYNELSTVNRTIYPWLVVGFHRPYFEPSVYGTTITGDVDNQRDLQDAFDDLFVQYGVDMTLFGHTHWYSRSCPLYKRNCVEPDANGTNLAPVHVNIGNAGASFSWDVIDPALLAQSAYVAMAVQHGYTRIHASRTTLTLQAVNAANGKLIDEFTLSKPAGYVTNSTAMLNMEKVFQGNRTNTWEEKYSGNELFVDNAEIAAYFKANDTTAMLQQLAAINPLENPVTGPDAFETYEGDFPFWQAIDGAFRKYLLTADTTDSKTLYYYNQVYGPLQTIFDMFPDGVFKGPKASAPAPTPSYPNLTPINQLNPVYTGPLTGSLNLTSSTAPGVSITPVNATSVPATHVSAASLG
jgi:hypothetical protein